MSDIGELLPQLHPELDAWLTARGIAPVGPPFWKYDVIDMTTAMSVEVAIPISELIATDDDRVVSGLVPAGRYATLRHIGHPDGLEAATGDLLAWVRAKGLHFDVQATERGELWKSRLEIYWSDPVIEPDMSKWVTDLAFLLR